MSAEKSIFITEEEKLKIHLQRSHKERLTMLLHLIKISQKLKNAKITEAKS